MAKKIDRIKKLARSQVDQDLADLITELEREGIPEEVAMVEGVPGTPLRVQSTVDFVVNHGDDLAEYMGKSHSEAIRAFEKMSLEEQAETAAKIQEWVDAGKPSAAPKPPKGKGGTPPTQRKVPEKAPKVSPPPAPTPISEGMPKESPKAVGEPVKVSPPPVETPVAPAPKAPAAKPPKGPDLFKISKDDPMAGMKRVLNKYATLQKGTTRSTYHQALNDPKFVKGMYDEFLTAMEKSGFDKAAIRQIKKIAPETLMKLGPKEMSVAMTRWGEDPNVAKLLYSLGGEEMRTPIPPEEFKQFVGETWGKKAPSKVTPEGTRTLTGDIKKGVKYVTGELGDEVYQMPEAKGATQAALKGAGVRGYSGGARGVLHKVLQGMTGGRLLGAAGLGLGMYMTAEQANDLFSGRHKRAADIVKKGISPLTGQRVPPVEQLRAMVKHQEAIERRKATLATQDPQLMEQIVQYLGESGEVAPKTQTEVVFGQALPRSAGAPKQEVLDELLNQFFNEIQGRG